MRDDRAPIESGGVQLVASSAAQPPRRSRVALRADGAPVEDKGRRKIGGAPPRPCQSRVAMSGKTDEKRRAAAPPRQSKAALSGIGAPIQEKTSSRKSGSRTQAATSSKAPTLHQSKVPMSFSGVPNKQKRRTTEAATSSTAMLPHQSKVAICGCGATIEKKTWPKSCSTQAAAQPLHQSRVPMSVSGVLNKENRRTKSCSTQAATSSTTNQRISKVAICGSGPTIKDKTRSKSSSTQAAASSMAPPLHQSREPPMSVSGVAMEEKRRTKSLMAKPPRRSEVAFGANGRRVDGVRRADIIEYYKHRDGSIYRHTDSLSKLYRLHDTNETGLEPMMRSEPLDSCLPNWRACETHRPHTMMQIFQLKLACPPCDVDPVQVYGFMAVRDTLDHLCNYIFNRTRDDPFTVEKEDGFIQMSSPKRGIWWCDMQLVEFDMRIKRGENEADDLQLIDGAFWVYDCISPHAEVIRDRIDGDYGSVDISYALLQLAMEGTVQIAVSELDRGFSLRVSMYYVSDLLHLEEEMQLFDGAIPVDAADSRYELDKYVVAASRHTKIALKLTIRGGSLDDDAVVWRFCLSPASTHGTDEFNFELGFATIDVKVSWSTLDYITCPISGIPLPYMRGYE